VVIAQELGLMPPLPVSPFANLSERIAAEKRAVELQVANLVDPSQLAPGIRFSVPSTANRNKEYLFRKEAHVSNATARLDARSKQKADRYCK
jgi:hypothetical protein